MRKSRSTTRARASGKLYKVYDLAAGGRLLKVRKDDPRFLEEDEALMAGREPRYPHRKPSKASKQRFAVGEVLGESEVARGLLGSSTARTVASTAVVAATPRILRAVPRAIKAATAARFTVGAGIAQGATVGGAGVVALLAAAGLGSYFGTRYIIENFPTKARRLAAAADAVKQARRGAAIAAGLGRDGAAQLPPAVLKALADHYRAVVADINKYPF